MLYKRGNKWYYKFEIHGKTIRKSTGTSDKTLATKIALEARRKAEEEILQPSWASSKGMRLSEALDKMYLEKWSQQKDDTGVRQRVGWVINKFNDPYLTEIEPDEIIKALKEEKPSISPATINRYLANVQTILNRAKRKWKVLRDVPLFEKLKESEGRIVVVSEEEEVKILRWLADNGFVEEYVLTVTLLETGLRLSEALNLTFEDVDTANKIITVWETKSGKPRSVPMTDRLLTVYENVYESVLKSDEKSKDKLFSRSKDQVDWTQRKWRKELNLPHISYHTFRHTYASRLIRKGANLYAVKELLGHSSVKVTERYAHLNIDHLREAVGKVV